MTQAELISLITLRIEMGVGIPVPPATYANYIEWEDISDYASALGVGESVETIIKVVSPVGIGVYENAGYASDDFSNPDYPTNNPNEAQLPLAASGNPVQGIYQFLIKAQFDDGLGNTFIVQKTISSLELCLDDEPTPVLSETYSCEAGTYTSTDVTEYGNANLTLLSVVRVHKVYPPSVSGQTPTTANAAVNEVGSLWTGTYEASLEATVTYQNGNNYFVFYIETDTELLVTCDSALCVLYCCLLKIRNKYYEFAAAQGLNSTEVQALYRKFLLGNAEYFMAVRAQLCGQSIDTHVVKFYAVTGCDPTCDCCDEDAPAPVIPAVTTLQGEDGTDGLTAEFQMSGTVFQWKYTTEVTWTNLIDFATLNLTPDFSGYNYLLIENDTTLVGTDANNSEKTLISETLTAGLLSADGDMVKLSAEFYLGATLQQKNCRVYFGAFVAAYDPINTTSPSQGSLQIIAEVTRTSATTQQVSWWVVWSGTPSVQLGTQYDTASETVSGAIITKMTGQNTTSVANDVASHRFKVEYFKKGTF